jgi:hypothetical protein
LMPGKKTRSTCWKLICSKYIMIIAAVMNK